MSWEDDLLYDCTWAWHGTGAARWFTGDDWPAVHLAIMREPYMQFVLDGSKTIESRWAKTRQAPWKQVEVGDLVLFSRAAASSGKDRPAGIVAVTKVTEVRFIEQRSAADLDDIRREHGQRLAVPQAFWKGVADRPFVSLLTVGRVVKLPPLTRIRMEKRDQRGWAVVRARP